MKFLKSWGNLKIPYFGYLSKSWQVTAKFTVVHDIIFHMCKRGEEISNPRERESDATYNNVLWDVFADCAFVKVKFLAEKIAQKSDKFFRGLCSSKDHSILRNNFVKLCKIPSKPSRHLPAQS